LAGDPRPQDLNPGERIGEDEVAADQFPCIDTQQVFLTSLARSLAEEYTADQFTFYFGDFAEGMDGRKGAARGRLI
jgi:hypothetical protein